MPQQPSLTIENSFVNGLVTEATGLNFPPSACTETYNCIFDTDGSVQRRLGFEFETGFQVKEIDRETKAVNTYLWENVAGNGDVSLLAVQIGSKVYLYKGDDAGSFSTGAVSGSIDLTPVSGAPPTDLVEAQFTSGNGFLFITHPYCDPIRVAFDIESENIIPTSIVIQIRDFEGDTQDPYKIDERPTATVGTLDKHHHYNLLNQGWTSTSLTAWDTAQTTMPSNADVMWRFKDTTEKLDFTNDVVDNVVQGNSKAPSGHFILNLANQDRSTASGIADIPATTTGFHRPSTSAFFAGRMFYSGIGFQGFNSNIYFSQIIENVNQYGRCHQVNDPTSEDMFDLLPSDGGVIIIPEAGTIYKLVTVPGGLCVFAANGIWFITGSTGIGFTAVDYTVQKITNITTLTATSFVNVAGYPCWWNSEGIYLMVAQGNLPQVQSLSNNKIKEFYDSIPISSKRYARGFYHTTDEHIRWIYRSTSTSQVTRQYEYDRVLNFNVKSGAFYPWTISDSKVTVNSIVPTGLISRTVTIRNVVDNNGDQVIDSLGNNVITFSQSGTDTTAFDKYLVSYKDNGTYKHTFAERKNEDFLDWYLYDGVGVNYESYMITGFKLTGQAVRKFQNNWVRIFSRITEPVQYFFQGIWDYAKQGSDTGRWSVRQICSHTDEKYSTASKRLKVRGNGLALQFRLSSVPNQPFDIIGWSNTQLTNPVP